MNSKIAVFGILGFTPDRVSEVPPHLRTLVEITYENDQCIAYDVAEEPFDSSLVRFSELWPDRVRGPLNKSIKRMMARRKETKKRSLHTVNEHFSVPFGYEFLFNDASAASGAYSEAP